MDRTFTIPNCHVKHSALTVLFRPPDMLGVDKYRPDLDQPVPRRPPYGIRNSQRLKLARDGRAGSGILEVGFSRVSVQSQ